MMYEEEISFMGLNWASLASQNYVSKILKKFGPCIMKLKISHILPQSLYLVCDESSIKWTIYEGNFEVLKDVRVS